MLKKEDIYVIVDTPKKEKKLRKVLDMLGENISHYPDHRDVLHNGTNGLGWGYGFRDGSWQGVNTKFVGHKEKVFTEVSVKELKTILEVEDILIELERQKHEVPNIEFELTPDDYKNNTWYKSKETNSIFFLEKGKKNYGFNHNYSDSIEWFKNFRENGFHIKGQWTEATEQEVLEAFTKGANSRFRIGDRFVSPDGKDYGYKLENTNYSFYKGGILDNIFGYRYDENTITHLFSNGKWATPVDPFAELKEAHKNGADIEYFNPFTNRWHVVLGRPLWSIDVEYRIKPEEKNNTEETPKGGDFVMAWNNNSDSKAIVGKLEHINFGTHYSVYKVGGNWYDNAELITEEQVIKAIFKK